MRSFLKCIVILLLMLFVQYSYSKAIQLDKFYIGLSVGKGITQMTDSINDYDNSVPAHQIFLKHSLDSQISSYNPSLTIGYQIMEFDKLAISPELYFIYSNKSQNSVTSSRAEGGILKQTSNIKVGNQFGIDLKLSYFLSHSNEAYLKLGWGFINLTRDDEFNIANDSNPSLFKETKRKTKNSQGILVGLGLSHAITKHLSVFLDWTYFLTRDNLEAYKQTISPFDRNITLFSDSSLKNISTDRIQVGMLYRF